MDITIAPYWLRMLPGMFPMFDEPLGEANNAHFRVMATLDFIQPENWIEGYCSGPGRPKIEREKFLRAFIAKTVLNIPTVVALLDRLRVDKVLKRICGWIFNKKIPCEGTFSNVFREFSESKICEKIHEKIITRALEDDLIFHISRDSTAISARELAPPKKEKKLRLAGNRDVPKRANTSNQNLQAALRSKKIKLWMK